MEARPAPPPSALRHLRASDTTGAIVAALTAAITALGLWLSVGGPPAAWVAGQLLLGLAMVEWFVLLHECGHSTLFQNRPCNAALGHVAGFFAFIPFGMWVHVHQQHHKWTGWQDLDPTTATLAPQPRGALQRSMVSICWKYWIPLFSIVYRLGNFWNPSRFARLRVHPRARVRIMAGSGTVAVLYGALVWRYGWLEIVRAAGAATVLAFVIEDMLLLSQHTHVPMELSQGRRVTPHKALDQERFTRSLRLPPLLSRFALHFDAHELHHMYPFVPGYRLREIPYEPGNEVPWWQWVRAARALPGDVLLFQNRRETGFNL